MADTTKPVAPPPPKLTALQDDEARNRAIRRLYDWVQQADVRLRDIERRLTAGGL